MATTVIINAAEQYIYRSEKSLTGTMVTSNYPIFVISGMNDTTDPEHAFLEHVVPDHALGKHYVLFVPFSGSTVYVTAYCKYIISVDAPTCTSTRHTQSYRQLQVDILQFIILGA